MAEDVSQRLNRKRSSRSIYIRITEDGEMLEEIKMSVAYFNAWKVYKALKALLECALR